MQTAYGEFFEEDVETLEYQLQWYLKYGNAPSSFRRESETAKIDYGTQYTAVRLKFPAKHAKYANSTRPALAGEASPSRAGDDATSVAGAKEHAFHPAPSAASRVRFAAAVFTCHLSRLSSPRKRLPPARHEVERKAATKDGAGKRAFHAAAFAAAVATACGRGGRRGKLPFVCFVCFAGKPSRFPTLPFLPDSSEIPTKKPPRLRRLKWCAMQDSDQRPLPCQGSALTN